MLGSHEELERPAWRIGYSQAGAIANNRVFDIREIVLDWVRIGPCLREGNGCVLVFAKELLALAFRCFQSPSLGVPEYLHDCLDPELPG